MSAARSASAAAGSGSSLELVPADYFDFVPVDAAAVELLGQGEAAACELGAKLARGGRARRCRGVELIQPN